jgi:hypothetical protein
MSSLLLEESQKSCRLVDQGRENLIIPLPRRERVRVRVKREGLVTVGVRCLT